MSAIGLDIGTTGICGIVMNSGTGAIEKVVSRKNDFWIAGEPWERLQDPEAVFETASGILDELRGGDTEAIGVTGQMHGILYFDRCGRSVSPLYTWQDGRGNLSLDGETYAEKLGSHTGYGNVTHFYNKKNNLIPRDAVGFCTIHDYAVMRLTGRNTPLVHASDAASFGCFDIKANRFTRTDDMQPQVTPDAEIAGRWQGIPVSAAIGDNQASFFGGGCDENTVLINVGTGSQISLISDAEDECGALEIRPLTNGKCIAVGSSLCGGRAYALLERFFAQTARMAGVKKDELYSEMAREIADMKDTDLKFETLFCGTRENPKSRAKITQLSADNFTPADMIFACLAGISDELFGMYESAGRKCTRMVGTGNGIRRNPVLQRIVEKQFGMRLQIPKFEEEAAAGAAVFALAAAGARKILMI
ncbi:MAG: hypothetical protein J6N52_03610 [Clostridia bacterium]|nr:hypothetical protein [Clostridia bacterium]